MARTGADADGGGRVAAAGAAGAPGAESAAGPAGAAAGSCGAAAVAGRAPVAPAAGTRPQGTEGIEALAFKGAAHASPFKVFLERRRGQHAEKGVTVALPALHAEWRRLPPAEKEEFEREARGRRPGGAAAGGVAELLARQDREPRAPLRRIDPNEPAPGKRRRADKPEAAVPRPAFPAARAAGATAAARVPGVDLAARARALRERAQGRGASLDLASSCDLDLTSVDARLSAPTLSFDCQDNVAPWAKEEDAAQAEGLEVCAPRDAKARSLMHSALRQQISSVRVRQLLQRGCAPGAAGQ